MKFDKKELRRFISSHIAIAEASKYDPDVPASDVEIDITLMNTFSGIATFFLWMGDDEMYQLFRKESLNISEKLGCEMHTPQECGL